jgi:hypothetical protein
MDSTFMARLNTLEWRAVSSSLPLFAEMDEAVGER